MLLSVTFLLGNVAIAASYRHLKMTSNVPVSPQVKFDIKKPMLAFFSASAALLLTKQPAFAFNREDANKILSSYDLPPILFIPPGFAPLVSEFGRGNIKKGFEQQNPILVQVLLLYTLGKIVIIFSFPLLPHSFYGFSSATPRCGWCRRRL